MILASLALAALTGPAASLAATGTPVTVWIRLPDAPAPADIQRVRESRTLLMPLLGNQLKEDILLPKEEDREKIKTLRLSGPEQPLQPEERHRIVERLYALWGRENVSIEAGALLQGRSPWARPLPRAPGPRLLARSPAEFAASIRSMVPSGLLSGDQGRFYDRSGLRDSLASRPQPVAVVKAQAAAPMTAFIPEAVRNTIVPEKPSVETLIHSAANEFKVDAAMIRAVIEAKSGFDPDKVSGGAVGLMGVAPGTARALASELGYSRKTLDPKDPAVNVRTGTKVLANLCRLFDCSTSEGRSRALAAYQVGPRAVIDSGGIPNDRFVKEFLERFELAYRAGSTRADGTVVKPPVVPVVPPKHPIVRQKTETWRELAAPAVPKDGVPGPVAQWLPIIDRFVQHFGLKERTAARGFDARKFIAAKVMQESYGDRLAVGGKGEQGLLQLMPETAARLGVKNGFDPLENLKAGIGFFSDLLGRLNDPILALAGYNAGPASVEDLKGKIPRSAEPHVKRVVAHYEAMGGGRVDLEPYLQPRLVRAASKRKTPASVSAKR